MRRIRKKKKQRKIIILSMICLLCIMTAGYAAFQTNLNISAKGNIKWDEACVNGNEWTYDYKYNTIYDFEAPCSGTYKLEAWGAQGGSALTLEGGYGGYSVGNIDLNRRQQLYIVVGGKGESSGAMTVNQNEFILMKGGYNGGGNGARGYCSGNLRMATGGGGATHIATSSGVLSSLEKSKENVIMVSGGGGGAYCSTFDGKTIRADGPQGVGGSAGGYIGNSAPWSGTASLNLYATGGSQEAGGRRGSSYQGTNSITGQFGIGGSGTSTGGCDNPVGGGSGYYGGGIGAFTPAAGGSSFINNSNLKEKHMVCYNCTTSDEEGIKTVSTTKVSDTPLVDAAKKGNGYAKITLLLHK